MESSGTGISFLESAERISAGGCHTKPLIPLLVTGSPLYNPKIPTRTSLQCAAETSFICSDSSSRMHSVLRDLQLRGVEM